MIIDFLKEDKEILNQLVKQFKSCNRVVVEVLNYDPLLMAGLLQVLEEEVENCTIISTYCGGNEFLLTAFQES